MSKDKQTTLAPVLDLSTLTAEQLQEELAKRKNAQDIKRTQYKELTNTCVRDIVDCLKKTSLMLQQVKVNTFQDLKALLDMKIEVYGLKQGQQSQTFSDADGNSITYGYRILDAWDDTTSAGIEKINSFIQTLAKDEESAKLVNAVNRLLKRDSKGNLKASRVLELSKMAEEFNDAVFTDGVSIITKAYKPVRSCFFIEGTYTDEQGNKINIPLSISGVDFPKEVNIAELFPIEQN